MTLETETKININIKAEAETPQSYYVAALFPDVESSGRILALRTRLATHLAGTPYPAPDVYSPHLTLFVCEGLRDETAVSRALAAAAQAQAQAQASSAFVATFSALGFFPNAKAEEGAPLFLAPVPDAALVQWRNAVYAEALPHIAGCNAAFYAPGSWMPHCTLFEKLPAPDLARISGAAAGIALPLAVNFTNVRLVTVPQYAVISEFALSERKKA